jgi:hypothetical protein
MKKIHDQLSELVRDRQRRRRDQRRAEPLQEAEADQGALGPGEAVEQGAGGEERQPGHEQAPSSEQVGHAAAQEQDAAEHDRVGGHDPLQVLLAEAEVRLDRGERHVDDRDVEDHHELGGDDHRQSEPAPSIGPALRHRVQGSLHLDLLLRFVVSQKVVRCWSRDRYGMPASAAVASTRVGREAR